ncbi:pentapeptide repeat-containing protein [Rhizobium leguminosarum]|uniref:pentapeptide repeat-containing protein n=1 Tax=Rhizobium leguminosarum TaxID=384 RepID=UPI001F369F1A|nr:pentapeptide repeat-containing protein [Rhizobium leguminosarum]
MPNPLLWLGQRDPDGSPPEKPLLLICDGLDEIAPPDSSEAATVTSDFIQALKNWMDSRNSGGFFTCAMVLGRTISAQEAFKKAAIDNGALIRVGGLLPISGTEEWRAAEEQGVANDLSNLADVDQRAIFWRNWCSAIQSKETDLPQALQGNTEAATALRELTTEPLLLYLLLWTGYLGHRWEVAAENRNNVYEEIFRQIYVRRWGIGPEQTSNRNREEGGHAATRTLEQSDFFLLQEALGLASWASGGRTVATESYNSMLRDYLHPDTHEDLSGDISSSLKSVAMQSYTRSIGGDDAGYEFVHKSLGEYLIARGLSTWILGSLKPLTERQSERRCSDAGAILAKITWHGPLTTEICRFFEDELRLRVASFDAARARLRHLVPLASWVLTHGIPVHREVPITYSVSRIGSAEQRSLDVFWTALQAVARQAYPDETYGLSEAAGGWSAGPLKITWHGPFGFASILSKLSSPSLVAETKRFTRFDYLDLQKQALTEITIGAVLYTTNHKDGTVSPREWFPVSLFGANLTDAEFYGSNLRNANLRRADLSDARLVGANLSNANLSYAVLRGASLSSARLEDVHLNNADFEGANLSGAFLRRCDLTGANLNKIVSGLDFPIPDDVVSLLVMQDCDLDKAYLRDVDLKDTVIERCSLISTDIGGANLSGTIIVGSNLDSCIITSETRLPQNESDLIRKWEELNRLAQEDAEPRERRSSITGILIRMEKRNHLLTVGT